MKFTSAIILAASAVASAHYSSDSGFSNQTTVSVPTSTVTYIYPISNTTTTTYCPPSSSSFVTLTTTSEVVPTTTPSVGPIATGTGSVGTGTPGGHGNSTLPTGTGSNPLGSATATPKSPSSTASVPFTGGATANQAGLVLASVGLLAAYFL